MRPNIETLDLRGLLCPLTWARTKYALSKLAAGGELKVIVDHRPAVPDIKRNAEEIGDEVLSTRETEEGVWEMVLRRCAR
ncbi:MAG: sulfurtransferase TusA family protein [Deltaproteobacteria bacterium]|nr:MAG: sulfurtransferase TusA family protein [Deltaproteobacteria bacterium]